MRGGDVAGTDALSKGRLQLGVGFAACRHWSPPLGRVLRIGIGLTTPIWQPCAKLGRAVLCRGIISFVMLQGLNQRRHGLRFTY